MDGAARAVGAARTGSRDRRLLDPHPHRAAPRPAHAGGGPAAGGERGIRAGRDPGGPERQPVGAGGQRPREGALPSLGGEAGRAAGGPPSLRERRNRARSPLAGAARWPRPHCPGRPAAAAAGSDRRELRLEAADPILLLSLHGPPPAFGVPSAHGGGGGSVPGRARNFHPDDARAPKLDPGGRGGRPGDPARGPTRRGDLHRVHGAARVQGAALLRGPGLVRRQRSGVGADGARPDRPRLCAGPAARGHEAGAARWSRPGGAHGREAMKPARPRFYFSFRSPYSWVGARKIEAQFPHHRLSLEYLPYWEPEPETRAELTARGGELLYRPTSQARQLYILQDVKRIWSKLGHRAVWPGDGESPCSELPHMAYLHARRCGRDPEVFWAVWRAGWGEGGGVTEVGTTRWDGGAPRPDPAPACA